MISNTFQSVTGKRNPTSETGIGTMENFSKSDEPGRHD